MVLEPIDMFKAKQTPTHTILPGRAANSSLKVCLFGPNWFDLAHFGQHSRPKFVDIVQVFVRFDRIGRLRE